MFIQVSGTSSATIFIVFLISFIGVMLLFSSIDWGKMLRVEKKQTWIAVGIWVVVSFAVAAMITFGILFIGGLVN